MTTARMQQRRDTAANWTAENPVLAAGEIGWESDTGRVKFGDGVTAWVALAAFAPSVVSQIVYTANGAITFAAELNTAIITKGSAAAMTLATPTIADNGKRLRIISDSAFNHTITTAANKLQGCSNAGAPLSGNRLTLSNGYPRFFVELEANNERWIVNGLEGYNVYNVITTV